MYERHEHVYLLLQFLFYVCSVLFSDFVYFHFFRAFSWVFRLSLSHECLPTSYASSIVLQPPLPLPPLAPPHLHIHPVTPVLLPHTLGAGFAAPFMRVSSDAASSTLERTELLQLATPATSADVEPVTPAASASGAAVNSSDSSLVKPQPTPRVSNPVIGESVIKQNCIISAGVEVRRR